MLCTLSFVYCIFWISCSSILWTFLHNELFFSLVAVVVFTTSPFRFVSSFIRNRSVALPYVLLITYSKLHPLLSRKRIHTTQYDILSNDITSKWTIATGHTQHHSGPSFSFIFRFFFFFFFSSLYSVFIFFPKESFVFFYVFIFSWNFMFVSVSVCSFSVELIIVMNLTFANTEVNKSPLDFAA